MNHQDHVRLIKDGVPAGAGGVWADIGAGRGAFSLALAELLAPGSSLHLVDRDGHALQANAAAIRRHYPGIQVDVAQQDFTRLLSLPQLDGLVMANALHFVHDKAPVLLSLANLLRPGGRFILVEYDTRHGNRWVPYPLTFADWVDLASKCGLKETILLATRPSSFLGRFFTALSRV